MVKPHWMIHCQVITLAPSHSGALAVTSPVAGSNIAAVNTSITAKVTPNTAKAWRLGDRCSARWKVGSR